MDFIDWCDHVLDKLIELAAASVNVRITGADWETDLTAVLFGEEAPGKLEFRGSMAHLGTRDALRQLTNQGLIEENGRYYKPTSLGEEFAADRTALWQAFYDTSFKPDQEQVLRIVNRLSSHGAEDHAWVEWVEHDALLAELGWEDGFGLLLAVSQELERQGVVRAKRTLGAFSLEATYPGLVWEHRRGVALASRDGAYSTVPFPRSEPVQPLLIRPRFRRRAEGKAEKLGFVLMPFESDFNDVLSEAIRPAIEENGLDCQRADDIQNNEEIMEDIWEAIWKCRIVVADLTDQNPNVFYEVGIADTVGKEVVLIAQAGRLSHPPFDVAARRVLFYDNDHVGRAKLRGGLATVIKAVLAKAPATDPPPALHRLTGPSRSDQESPPAATSNEVQQTIARMSDESKKLFVSHAAQFLDGRISGNVAYRKNLEECRRLGLFEVRTEDAAALSGEFPTSPLTSDEEQSYST